MPFAHEKLDVYNLALEFLVLADDLIEHLPEEEVILPTNSVVHRPRSC